MAHAISRFDEANLSVPDGYGRHSRGYRRAALVGPAEGSVHMGHGIAELAGDGELEQHVHAFEKGFYVLEGSVDFALDGRAYRLRAGDYAVVGVGAAHAFRGAGERVRWLEMIAPQPRPKSVGEDTFFVGAFEWPRDVQAPDGKDARTRFVGHFEDGQLPPPGYLQMDGYSGGNVEGIRLKMLIDRNFGAHHMTLFMVEFVAGGGGKHHDHPFEESYFMLSGEADCVLEGQHYVVRAGDCVWTGVGAEHAFFTKGDVPVRWIETQSPQPPPRQAFRFTRDWDAMRERYPV